MHAKWRSQTSSFKSVTDKCKKHNFVVAGVQFLGATPRLHPAAMALKLGVRESTEVTPSFTPIGATGQNNLKIAPM